MTLMIWNLMPMGEQRVTEARRRKGMAAFGWAWLAAGLLGLGGCGGGGGNADPAPAPGPSNDVPPLITAPGTPVGDPVSLTVTPAGGVASAAGVGVVAQAGSFATDATLTVQPTTNPVQDGMAAVAISGAQAWSAPLIMRFPIAANEDSPEGLGVAARRRDGSWLSLPVEVDRAARTVNATLPYDIDAAPAAGNVRATPASNGRPQAALDLRDVVAYRKFFVWPPSARVKVGGTQTFVAYARVITEEGGDDCKWCVLLDTSNFPFKHEKEGFDRYWSVDAIPWGDSDIGTLAKSDSSTVTYTAPQHKPSPDTVTVRFHSVNVKTGRTVPSMTATVKIEDDSIQTYVGQLVSKANIVGVPNTSQGEVTWTLIEHLPGDLSKYQASGTVEVSTAWPQCDLAVGRVPVKGTLVVYDADRGGAGDPWAAKYWFSLEPNEVKTVSVLCGSEPRRPFDMPLVFHVLAVCPQDTTVATALVRYADKKALEATGTWKCPEGQSVASWNFKAH